MGLLKTGLKAAVAVKPADVIHERVLARQQEHAAAQGYPATGGSGGAAWLGPPIAAVSPDMGDKLAQLKQLGELRESGVLTDAEFEAQKAQILSA
jgi:hypothetical protein